MLKNILRYLNNLKSKHAKIKDIEEKVPIITNLATNITLNA